MANPSEILDNEVETKGSRGKRDMAGKEEYLRSRLKGLIFYPTFKQTSSPMCFMDSGRRHMIPGAEL